MKRTYRNVFVLLAILATVVIPSAPALGWGNGGVGSGPDNERDGFGTHDWVVARAVQSAGSAGAWLVDNVALEATDDPDTLGRSDNSELDEMHLYREKGTGRGAVHEVSELYNQAVAQHAAGNLSAASRSFGLLSHYYADIMVPYHAAYAGLGKDTAHHEYEKLVDLQLNDAGDKANWYVARSPVLVTNVRKHAAAAAAYSRAKFDTLHTSFTSTWSLNSTVSGITQAVLSRAANDLGDLLKTIPTHGGGAPAVNTLSSSVKIRYIGQNQIQGVYVSAKGTDGNPIEGLAVDIDWPLPGGGTTTERVYTMPDGKAKLARNVGASPLMVRRGVVSSTTTGSITKTSKTWWMATPKLADGSTGFSAKPSDYTPSTTVTIKARTVNTAGNPVEGLKVTFTWKFASGTIKTVDYTNSNGYAVLTRDISKARDGYTVYVETHVQSGGLNRYWTTRFTP